MGNNLFPELKDFAPRSTPTCVKGPDGVTVEATTNITAAAIGRMLHSMPLKSLAPTSTNLPDGSMIQIHESGNVDGHKVTGQIDISFLPGGGKVIPIASATSAGTGTGAVIHLAEQMPFLLGGAVEQAISDTAKRCSTGSQMKIKL